MPLPTGMKLRAVQALEAPSLLLPTVTPFCCELRNSCFRAKLPLHTESLFLCLGALAVLREAGPPSPSCFPFPRPAPTQPQTCSVMAQTTACYSP